jgi:hypothetical protein
MGNCDCAVDEGDAGVGVGRGEGCDDEVAVAACDRVSTAREVRLRGLQVTWRVCGLPLTNHEVVVGPHELLIRVREA